MLTLFRRRIQFLKGSILRRKMSSDKLPSCLIALSSEEGQQLVGESTRINTDMIKHHKDQIHRCYCGPASLALLSNSINASYRIRYMGLNEGDKEQQVALEKEMEVGKVLVDENNIMKCLDQTLIEKTEIDTKGITLEQLGEFAMHLGFGVTTYYTLDKHMLLGEASGIQEKLSKSDSSVRLLEDVEGFKETMLGHVSRLPRNNTEATNQIQGVIGNYRLDKLGFQSTAGHISPVAAYHKEKDMFLVMDVWPDIPPFWVPTHLLWESMNTVDTESGLTRGFLHVYELM